MRSVFLVVLLLGLALANHLPDPVIIGGFQGSFGATGSSRPTVFFCEDGEGNVQGSFSELGLIRGTVSGSSLSGDFVQAGQGQCNSGTFEIELTSWGFEGTLSCEETGNEFSWVQVRLSNVRPSDDQCALLDQSEDKTVEGLWNDNHGNPMAICFSGDLVQASYSLSRPDPFDWYGITQGYFEGVQGFEGKVARGTWYENRFSAGAFLFFLRNTGEVQVWRWTGLAGIDGTTAIDPTQLYKEEDHNTLEYPYKRGYPEQGECGTYKGVKSFVILNLSDDDEDYYYFVGDSWFTSEFEPLYNLEGLGLDEVESSSAIMWAANMSLIVVLALSMFI